MDAAQATRFATLRTSSVAQEIPPIKLLLSVAL
jgi:hypothetical protein